MKNIYKYIYYYAQSSYEDVYASYLNIHQVELVQVFLI
jgi:hypothetical protein